MHEALRWTHLILCGASGKKVATRGWNIVDLNFSDEQSIRYGR